jgi:hypothetical protein
MQKRRKQSKMLGTKSATKNLVFYLLAKICTQKSILAEFWIQTTVTRKIKYRALMKSNLKTFGATRTSGQERESR